MNKIYYSPHMPCDKRKHSSKEELERVGGFAKETAEACKTACKSLSDLVLALMEEKTMTNEEKIRTMSREELAEFLIQIDLGPNPYCRRPCAERCEDCAIEWLGEEAE